MPAKKLPKPKKTPKAKPKPARKLKAKSVAKEPRPARLAVSAAYLAAQPTSPVAPQMATRAADLRTKRDALVASEVTYTTVNAALETAHIAVVSADALHTASIANYVHDAINVADGDATVLKSLGVDASTPARLPVVGPAPIVTGVFTLEGPTSGAAYVRCARHRGVAAFLMQYKLEPAAQGAPPTDWLPQGGYATKNVEWLLEGLPAGAAFRVRIQAIGSQVGPWSAEVLGKAR